MIGLLATFPDLLAVLPAPANLPSMMEQAFYPVLLGVLIIASLGVPIPEDVPLLVAGFLLRTEPSVASWPGTLAVALIGILAGDQILYAAGRRWGSDVFRHRSVSWLITPSRLDRAAAEFHRRGMWYCFFGRFVMGVRSVMCITAGVVRFPYWRFLLADAMGAMLSVPFFVGLGFLCAHVFPTLRRYVANAQGIVVVIAAMLVLSALYIRRRRKRARALQEQIAAGAQPPFEEAGPPELVKRARPKLGAPLVPPVRPVPETPHHS